LLSGLSRPTVSGLPYSLFANFAARLTRIRSGRNVNVAGATSILHDPRSRILCSALMQCLIGAISGLTTFGIPFLIGWANTSGALQIGDPIKLVQSDQTAGKCLYPWNAKSTTVKSTQILPCEDLIGINYAWC
jgi:hypothetical protein